MWPNTRLIYMMSILFQSSSYDRNTFMAMLSFHCQFRCEFHKLIPVFTHRGNHFHLASRQPTASKLLRKPKFLPFLNTPTRIRISLDLNPAPLNPTIHGR
jgi:hypothetical protein